MDPTITKGELGLWARSVGSDAHRIRVSGPRRWAYWTLTLNNVGFVKTFCFFANLDLQNTSGFDLLHYFLRDSYCRLFRASALGLLCLVPGRKLKWLVCHYWRFPLREYSRVVGTKEGRIKGHKWNMRCMICFFKFTTSSLVFISR